MRRRSAWVLSWSGLAVSVFTLSGADGGAISGRITTPDGAGVDAALTLHDLETVRVVGNQAFDHQFSSKRNGDFALADVPPGKYEICVDAPHRAVLDPCRWGTSEKFSVKAGETTSKIDVTVERGYRLEVRIDDPKKLLPNAPGGIPGAALLLAIQSAKGRYENLRLETDDAAGRTQFLVIPYDTPLTLVATGSGIALSDSNDKRYTGDSIRIPVLVASGSTLPVIKLKVKKP